MICVVSQLIIQRWEGTTQSFCVVGSFFYFYQKKAMPVNRNALIRYKTLDKCLQNRQRKWTLDHLIEACSEALYEYEGIDKGVSKRSVQADIQMMRSDKLGYNAPIVVVDRKYYTYADPDYSITNIPLTEQDLGRLTEAVSFLKQFQGFSHFRELEGMVQKLEDHVYAQQTKRHAVIDFEKNENLKGLEYLDALYQSIIHQRPLQITYQSFKAREAQTFTLHPYLLKEFRNRWFLIGAREEQVNLLTLALDRIEDLAPSSASYRHRPDFSAEAYFKHAIGVSVSPKLPPLLIVLKVSHQHAPYVLTKPLHWTQEEIERDYYGVTISLQVQHNFELEKEILALGDGITVLEPPILRKIIQERLTNALDHYHTALSPEMLDNLRQKLEKRGSSILQKVYTQRQNRKMGYLLHKYLGKQTAKTYAIRHFFEKIPALKEVVCSPNLQTIVKAIDPKAFLCRATLFDKKSSANWLVSWHQDVPIEVAEKKTVEGFSSWTQKEGVYSVCPPDEISRNRFSIRIHLDDTTWENGALKVIPGSQNKRLKDEEINLISKNSFPEICEVAAGGIHLMKPLILHASEKVKTSPKKLRQRRVIHLDFASLELPGGLDWYGRQPF